MTGLKVVEVNVFVQDVKILTDEYEEKHEDIEIV